MDKDIKLLQLSKVLCYLELGEIDKQRLHIIRTNIIKKAKRKGLGRVKEGGYYLSFDQCLFLVGTYKAFKQLDEAKLQKAFRDFQAYQETKNDKQKSLRRQLYPFYYHERLEALLEKQMRAKRSIKKLLQSYWEKLQAELFKASHKSTSILKIMTLHRNILKDFANKGYKKNFFVYLKERTSYAEDLFDARRYYITEESIKQESRRRSFQALERTLSQLKHLPLSCEELQTFLGRLRSTQELKDWLVLVLIATGRRLNEVLQTGKFEVIDVKTMRMKGALKKRGDKQIIEFKVLWDATDLKNLIEILQASLLKPEKIRYYFKKNYSFLGSKIHDLRNLNGAYTYLAFAPKGMHKNLWLNKQLGHEWDNLNSSFHYSGYQVPRQ